MEKNDYLNKLHGWLIIDKPSGIGSTKIVNVIKKKIGIKKIGHWGTLDPDATGVLALALGEATKTIKFIENSLKTYRFTIRLGISTDTDDSSGNIINKSKIRPKTKTIKDVIKNFEGEISQIPPRLSAIKINGKRAYNLFREGKKYELSPRQIFVENINVLQRKNIDELTIELTCGKGGYVRSIARDLGDLLGCYGHAHGIKRLKCGPFSIEGSICLDKFILMSNEELKNHILPIGSVLKNLPNFTCKAQDLNKILNGVSCKIKQDSRLNYDLALINHKNIPLAFGEVKNEVFFPTRVFNILKRNF